MAVKVVVGAQFGDEGKGKMIDWLAGDANLVVRFQGGDNAGHTVINEFGVFKLHIVPCGIFHENCKCLIGTGTVVNPDVLIEEMDMLRNAGIRLSNLFLSEKAQLIMPWHVALDEAMERSGGIGTTKRGVGQAYADKYLRMNLRAEDLCNEHILEEKLSCHLGFMNAQLAFYNAKTFSYDAIMEKCLDWNEYCAARVRHERRKSAVRAGFQCGSGGKSVQSERQIVRYRSLTPAENVGTLNNAFTHTEDSATLRSDMSAV